MNIALRYLAQMKPPEMQLDSETWSDLLALAKKLGWNPLGTILLIDDFALLHPQWDGNYDRPEGQLITPPDGLALAEALRRAEAIEDGYIDYYELSEHFIPVADFVAKGNVSLNDTEQAA